MSEFQEGEPPAVQEPASIQPRPDQLRARQATARAAAEERRLKAAAQQTPGKSGSDEEVAGADAAAILEGVRGKEEARVRRDRAVLKDHWADVAYATKLAKKNFPRLSGAKLNIEIDRLTAMVRKQRELRAAGVLPPLPPRPGARKRTAEPRKRTPGGPDLPPRGKVV